MTLIPFLPSPLAAFQFQVTLDLQAYNCVVTWNVFGQRWYVSIYDQEGTRIVTIARISSPPSPDPGISLTAGYFNSTLIFRDDDQMFEVNP